ncbi:MAG: hypothetical protein GTO14_23400 [Anaerolineales bacterium]|nr:hypothetical protein [Anaerolineales bacterium]
MITIDQYLLFVFIVSVLINLASTLMFLSRVHRPEYTNPLAIFAIILGLPALVLMMLGVTNDFGIAYWIMPLLYVVFSVFALSVDFIWKIEFRQPRRLEILIPFLLLYFVSLIGMWGMLWNLGLVYWVISGVTYFSMVASAIYALRKGVG